MSVRLSSTSNIDPSLPLQPWIPFNFFRGASRMCITKNSSGPLAGIKWRALAFINWLVSGSFAAIPHNFIHHLLPCPAINALFAYCHEYVFHPHVPPFVDTASEGCSRDDLGATFELLNQWAWCAFEIYSFSLYGYLNSPVVDASRQQHSFFLLMHKFLLADLSFMSSKYVAIAYTTGIPTPSLKSI